ncbi:MAG: hypothetical protein L6Q71_09600 [Planctomycetes bacterium]|nr:hypothetical protein [Planctomycetota bacterium]
MLAVMLLIAICGIVLVEPVTLPDGSQALGWIFADGSMEDFLGGSLAPGISMLQIHVELWTVAIASFLYSVAMLGFIAACAGYFPGLMTAGAIDVIVAKPASRLTIFTGKYLGGLMLFAAAILGTYFLLLVGLGFRTGIWTYRVLYSIPLTIFCGAVLYAMIAYLGVLSRSATLCVVLGYVFYLVIDTFLGLAEFDSIEWLHDLIETLRYIFPNFLLMKKATLMSMVEGSQDFDMQPIYTGAVWLLACLLLGFSRFRRMDF